MAVLCCPGDEPPNAGVRGVVPRASRAPAPNDAASAAAVALPGGRPPGIPPHQTMPHSRQPLWIGISTGQPELGSGACHRVPVVVHTAQPHSAFPVGRGAAAHTPYTLASVA